MQKTVILCYGDSNTHGMTPITDMLTPIRGRYSRDVRWPSVMQNTLGEFVEVIEEGLPGRTTCLDDPVSGGIYKNGLTYLPPCLSSHFPLDMVILMLGTNDLKAHFQRSPVEIGAGIEALLDTIIMANVGRDGKQPIILLLSPPPIIEIDTFFAGGREKSQQLAPLYQEIAQRREIPFLDVGEIIEVSPQDGIHFEATAHQYLGQEIAKYVNYLLKSQSNQL